MCYRLGAILFTGDSLTACDRGLCTPGWFWSEQATATEDILKRIDRRGVTVIADGQGTVLADLAF
jgi:glyoxylase-like metal-dependent hydrolase (beta-lactamase superfamily II)